mgnify:CR=1 FL=1
MAKEAVISTEAVNSYGSRVITAGIDTAQYERNPVLLWMHRRSWEAGAMPIGRMENMRREGDRLIGTPVFDLNDEFARQIADKWENGFLRMVSAGLEPMEQTDDPALVLPGQTRQTVTKSRLIEVSVVDIGGNDEALQLYQDGKALLLAAGEECESLRLLKKENEPDAGTAPDNEPGAEPVEEKNKPQTTTLQMNKEILILLGLPETATEEQAVASLRLMKERADRADEIQLSAITAAVDSAVAEKRIMADQREHFIGLGKAAGLDNLTATLRLMPVMQKPTDVIKLGRQSAPGAGAGTDRKEYTKLSEVPGAELIRLRKENPEEYARLYKAEYCVDCPPLED